MVLETKIYSIFYSFLFQWQGKLIRGRCKLFPCDIRESAGRDIVAFFCYCNNDFSI